MSLKLMSASRGWGEQQPKVRLSTSSPWTARPSTTSSTLPRNRIDDRDHAAMNLHSIAREHLVTAAQLNTLGIDPNRRRALLKGGTLRRLIRGWYAVRPPGAERAPWEGVDRFETARNLHRLTTRALVRSFDGRAAASHHSALVLAEARLWSSDLTKVHLSRTADDHSRRRTGAVLHNAIPVQPVMTHGVLVVPLAVAAIQVGLVPFGTPLETLVVADGLLAEGLITPEELIAAAALFRNHVGIGPVRAQLKYANALHESAGETLLGSALRGLGYQTVAQPKIMTKFGPRHPDFGIVGEPAVIEFDGLGKYLGAEASPDVATVRRRIAQEKAREREIRSCGFGIGRIVWADLRSPHTIREIVEAAIREGRALSTDGQTAC